MLVWTGLVNVYSALRLTAVTTPMPQILHDHEGARRTAIRFTGYSVRSCGTGKSDSIKVSQFCRVDQR
ncbi:hypothetical protein GCM10027200_22860 [Lentzea nigeriaca]